MEVFEAKPEDLAQVADWYASEWAEPKAAPVILKDLTEKLAAKKIYSMKTFFDGAQLIGVACLQKRDMGTAHPEYTPWLAGVYVSAKYRGQGIGNILTKAILAEAQKKNFKTCYLFTDSSEAWYQRQGWSLLNHETYKGKHVAVMKFAIASNSVR